MPDTTKDQDFLDCISFLGEVLGPFFLNDPQKGSAQTSFQAIQELDLREAANTWPFVETERAEELLTEMQKGLNAGVDADDLTWEYRRLFIGPGQKPAPPWGSVYTDRECVMFGESTLALRGWMREQGIDRLQSKEDPEDHIGLMLLLMSWIAINKADLLEEYLSQHLLTWSSHFLKQLSDATKHPFYHALAQLTEESLEGVRKTLALTINYPKYFR